MITDDKILGVFVDNNLTWSNHIKHLTKKKILQIYGSFQTSRNSFLKLIENNFISHTFNPILTFAILSGVIYLRQIN